MFATNIFPLSKFGFAHMPFITFTMCTFYCVKRYAQTEHLRYLLFSLISYLVVIFSYNESYILPIPALLLYIVLLLYPKYHSVKRVLLGILLCFSFLLFWKIKSIISAVSQIQPKILFEGAYGLLFSPGKSIFLYSPPLVLLIIFWHRIQKRLLPEVLSFLFLFAIYVFSYGSATISIPGAQELRPIWYGGAVWGPRYMAMLIPPLMLIIFHIITRLSSLQKKFIVTPVFVLGALIQLLGVAVPYQVQYRGLPYHFFIDTTEITRYEYASFIPRYSPIITMTRDFLVKIHDFPKTIDHGLYGVRFYDGFETPLRTGIGVFRGIKSVGHLSFTQKAENPIQSISFLLYNNPDEPTSMYSAQISGSLNTHILSDVSVIPVSKDGSFSITPPAGIIQNGMNLLDVRVTYVGTSSAQNTLYVKKMTINNNSVNLQSLDYPDVSTLLGEKTTSIPYQYWGKTVTDPWQLWNLRARIYEETFDFWWLKNVYYWDKPQTFLSVLFLINIASMIFFFKKTRYLYKKK